MRDAMRMLFLLVACACVSTQLQLAGQQPPPDSVTAKEIRGSEHPELIPETHAIAALLAHLSDGPKAMPWGDRVAFLEPSSLRDEQITAVLDAANKYKATLNAFAAKVQAIKAGAKGPLSAAQTAGIEDAMRRADRDRDDLILSLKKDLGVQGTQKFLDFVEKNWKRHMVYYPGAQK